MVWCGVVWCGVEIDTEGRGLFSLLLLGRSVEFVPAFEGFAGCLLNHRLVAGENLEPVVEVGGRVIEGRGGEQTALVEADTGEQFRNQFLFGVLGRAEAVLGVSAFLLQRVTDFVEQRGIVLFDSLEGFFSGHPDSVHSRRVVGRVASVRHGASVEARQFLSLFHGGEGDDLVGSLEVGQTALVHGEDCVVASEQEFVVRAIGSLALLLVFDLGEEGHGQTLSPRFDLTTKGFDLVEGEVVVIRAEEGEGEGVDPAVGLTADPVLRGDADPRLLPRGDSVLEALDESVSNHVSDCDLGGGVGGGGHLVC